MRDLPPHAVRPGIIAGHLLGISMLVATLIALPIAPSDLDRHQFPKETAVLLGVFLALVLVRPSPGRRVQLVIWPAMALLGWSVLTIIAADNPWLAIRGVALTAAAVGVLAVGCTLDWERGGRIALGWIAVAVVAGALTGLAQAMGYEHAWFARLRAPGGTFGNRNFLAHAAAIALPLSVGWSLLGRRRAARIGGLMTIAVLTMMLMMTRSRAGWLAAAGGIAGLGILLFQARGTLEGVLGRRQALAVAGAAVLGVLTALLLPTSLEWRSDSPYRDTLGNLANFSEGSGRGRMLQYRNTIELALRHPILGVGPGNWPLRYGEVAPADDPSWIPTDVVPLNPWPSSDAMAMISERGLPGAGLAGLLALALLWTAWSAVGRGGDTATWGAVLGGTVVAVGIAGVFDAVLLLAVPSLLAASVAGILVGRIAPGTPTDGRGRALWVLLVPLVAIGLVRSAQQTAAYLLAGDGSRRDALERAVRVDPFSYQIQLRLARRGPCRVARTHAEAALRLAPTWPAARAAARRCGVPQLAERPHSDQLPS
jgi:hypothetical protein